MELMSNNFINTYHHDNLLDLSFDWIVDIKEENIKNKIG
jgi:hypothetical protein